LAHRSRAGMTVSLSVHDAALRLPEELLTQQLLTELLTLGPVLALMPVLRGLIEWWPTV
jgi:hypothetical protein